MTLAQEKRNVRAWFRYIGYDAATTRSIMREATARFNAARSMRGT